MRPMARKMGSSDGIESIGAPGLLPLDGEEIASMRSKIPFKVAGSIFSPAVSSSLSNASMVSDTVESELS